MKVEFYSGYKDAETPRSVWIDNQQFQVREVLWRKRIKKSVSGGVVEAFKVKIDEDVLIIEKSESGECWALRRQDS